jgi:hypothetical protein
MLKMIVLSLCIVFIMPQQFIFGIIFWVFFFFGGGGVWDSLDFVEVLSVRSPNCDLGDIIIGVAILL